jgi:steroid delta-isomerase-like uncharacterized protein
MQTTLSLDANKELVRQFAAICNAQEWDRLAGIVADNFTRHSAATPGPDVTSRDQFIALQKSFLTSFPDQRVTLRQLVAEADRVAALATYSATHAGPLGAFPATGKKVDAPFLALFRIEAGRLAELWAEWDNLAMLNTLGVLPAGMGG